MNMDDYDDGVQEEQKVDDPPSLEEYNCSLVIGFLQHKATIGLRKLKDNDLDSVHKQLTDISNLLKKVYKEMKENDQ